MTQKIQFTHADLVPHWLVSAALLLMIVIYNIVCHVWGSEFRLNLDESQRVLIRSILYGLTIVLFPLVNLLRHILLRLNQTMPGDKPARQRYLLTVVVSLSLIETVGVFGFVMFMLGDDFNTLTIFSVLAALGIFLHKPKLHEYLAIHEALTSKNN